jgi:hypothetical protein
LFRRPAILTSAIAAGFLVVAGCESSSRSVTGPSGSKCAISIPANLPPLGAAGGSGSLAVTAARECAWSAASGAAWITIANGSGRGSGAVTYTVAPNPVPNTRQGALLVGDSRATVLQDAAACVFDVSPPSHDIAASGGTARATVATIAGCAWQAFANDPWIEIVDGSSGSGPGRVTFRAAPNAGLARTAILSIAGHQIAVRQDAPGAACDTAIGATDLSVPAGGASPEIAVTAGVDCQWTATSHDAWIAVMDGGGGSGNGVVRLVIDPNTGGERVGTVTIGSRTVTVTQAGSTVPCSYIVSPAAHAVGAGGGGAAVAVTAAGGCGWTAVSHASWIVVVAGAQGNGSGTVTLAVSANTGQERVGTVTVAGQSVSVTQAPAPAPGPAPDPDPDPGPDPDPDPDPDPGPGPDPSPACSYSADPLKQIVPLVPLSAFTVAVQTQQGCAWTAESNHGWITITNGGTGTGSGTVTYTVDLTLLPRTGTIEVAGQTVTVDQRGQLLSTP